MKERLPRKLKKEMPKLRKVGLMQIQFGTRKGFGFNKWTWKLYARVCRFLMKSYKESFPPIGPQPTEGNKNILYRGYEYEKGHLW